MKLYAFRLTKGDKLKESLEDFIRSNQISAASVIGAVGSLSKVHVRMAGAAFDKQDIRGYEGSFEIVSLIGNLGMRRTHLHISFSDNEGRVIGGHLKEESVVHTTAEIVLAVDETLIFDEEIDQDTGFGELKVLNNGN